MPRHTPSRCPTCGHFLDAASHLPDDNVEPRPGDLSLCIGCGEFLLFTDDLAVVRLSTELLTALESEDPEAVAELWKVRRLIITHRENLA